MNSLKLFLKLGGFGLGIVFFVGCAQSGAEWHCPTCNKDNLIGESSSAFVPTNTDSIFAPKTTWVKDTGKPMSLEELAGGPCVLSFIFTSCSFKCPITVDNMRQIEASLPRSGRSHCRFVLITFDPEFDTSEILRRYRSAHRLKGDNWFLLRGEPSEVNALAKRLNFGYIANGVGGFNHDSKISVLDADGRLVYQNSGLYGGVSELQLKVRELLKPRPLENPL